MNKLSLPVATAVAVVFLLTSCGKTDNPLVSATDGQFLQWIAKKNGLAPSCAAALYEPELFVRQYNSIIFVARDKIALVSEQQKSECVSELLQRANQVGIQGNVTRDHLRDDRVRQRYLTFRKG